MSYMMTFFVLVLVECNHNFFLTSFVLSLISGICAEAATDYAAVSLYICCYFYLQQHFVCSEALSKALMFAMFLYI